MLDGELLTTLQDCGAKLPESARPAPAEYPNLIAGLIYWLATGSTVPPEPEAAPESHPAADTETERLRARLAEVERERDSASTPPPITPATPSPATPAPSEGTGASDSAPLPPSTPASE